MTSVTTLGALRRALAARLRDAGIESPELDVRFLASHALGLNTTALFTQEAHVLSPEESASLEAFIERRLKGEPVARIIGTAEFWSLPLKLSPATLIPRPETETIVEEALDILRGVPSPRIADLGTGTGAILFAILSERMDASGVGIDLSQEAVTTARENAAALGLSERAEIKAGDFTKPLDQTFDIIVSNPPYILSGDIDTLARDVREHDPRLALDGGTDGLFAYRAIASIAPAALKPGGSLVVEAGIGQAQDIAEIMRSAGLSIIRPPRADLSGHLRAVAGQSSGCNG